MSWDMWWTYWKHLRFEVLTAVKTTNDILKVYCEIKKNKSILSLVPNFSDMSQRWQAAGGFQFVYLWVTCRNSICMLYAGYDFQIQQLSVKPHAGTYCPLYEVPYCSYALRMMRDHMQRKWATKIALSADKRRFLCLITSYVIINNIQCSALLLYISGPPSHFRGYVGKSVS
jgi:hypothetical protein